jgi:hypothetical protein
MPIGHYGFDYGTVESVGPASIAIALTTEKKVVQTDDKHQHNERLRGFLRSGSEVVCSWWRRHSGGDAGAPSIIVPTAVEHANRWRLSSSYQNLYSHSRRIPGINAEYWFRDMLWAAGVRADHATGFADEHLGVDLWVFLFYGKQWRWIPVDVTFKKLYRDSGTPTSKFSKAMSRGVFPVRISPANPPRQAEDALVMLMDQIRTAQPYFFRNDQFPIYRHQAHARELEEFPLSAQQVT